MREAYERHEAIDGEDVEQTGFRGMYEGAELLFEVEEGDEVEVNDSYLKSTLTVTRVKDHERSSEHWQSQSRWIEVESPYGGKHAFQVIEADITHEDCPDVSQFQVRPLRWRTDTEEWMNNSDRMHTFKLPREFEVVVTARTGREISKDVAETRQEAWDMAESEASTGDLEVSGDVNADELYVSDEDDSWFISMAAVGGKTVAADDLEAAVEAAEHDVFETGDFRDITVDWVDDLRLDERYDEP